MKRIVYITLILVSSILFSNNRNDVIDIASISFNDIYWSDNYGTTYEDVLYSKQEISKFTSDKQAVILYFFDLHICWGGTVEERPEAVLLQNEINNHPESNIIKAFGGSYTYGGLRYLYQFKEDHRLKFSLSEPEQLGKYYKYFNKTFVFIGKNNHLVGTLDADTSYEEIEQMIGRTLASYEGIYLKKNMQNIVLTEPTISIDLNDTFIIPDGMEPEITIFSNSDPYIVAPSITGTDLIINKTEFVGVSKIYVQIKVPGKNIMFRTSFYVFNSDNNHEDFEYTNLTESPYPWESSGKRWEISNYEYFTGSNSLVSPEIADEDSSSASITLQIDKHGYVSFAYKTSTEAYFDYLSFSIDGVQMESMETYSLEWSGENDWRTVFYNVRPGTRTFNWTYHKNNASADGDDKVWIDSIVLPGNTDFTSINNDFITDNFQLKNYPNPFNPITQIEFSLKEAQNIKSNIFNIQGRLIKTLFDGYANKGYNPFIFDANNLSNGIYYAVLKTKDHQNIRKMILIK